MPREAVVKIESSDIEEAVPAMRQAVTAAHKLGIPISISWEHGLLTPNTILIWVGTTVCFRVIREIPLAKHLEFRRLVPRTTPISSLPPRTHFYEVEVMD